MIFVWSFLFFLQILCSYRYVNYRARRVIIIEKGVHFCSSESLKLTKKGIGKQIINKSCNAGWRTTYGKLFFV